MPRGNRLDLIGQQFGDWTVLERRGVNRHRQALWLCRCKCGAEALVHTGNLRTGRSKRCRPCGSFLGHDHRRDKEKES